MTTIFLDNGRSKDSWIINKIGDDIKDGLMKSGYHCRIGGIEDYQGEDVCYHLFYNSAVPFKDAKHNSIFITHTDDKLKEVELVNKMSRFDSFICMSPEDVQFLIEIGFDKKKVFGISLPVRNTYVRPISIGIFSACYPDGRKNEAWLLNYCRTHEIAKLVNFVFIGTGWGKVVSELETLKCSSEWHNVSRTLPYEYQYQQNILTHLDYYMYMGMDGGAMGTYDAYAQCVSLCVTYDGFHKSLPNIDYAFDNEETLHKQLDIIIHKHQERLNYFSEHTPENYAKWLFKVWTGELEYQTISEKETNCISYNSVLEKRRENYFPISWHRLRRILISRILRIKNKVQ